MPAVWAPLHEVAAPEQLAEQAQCVCQGAGFCMGLGFRVPQGLEHPHHTAVVLSSQAHGTLGSLTKMGL